MKRQYRELQAATKAKIAQAATGKPKSAIHRQHISQAMRDYWATVPSKPQQEDSDEEDNNSGIW